MSLETHLSGNTSGDASCCTQAWALYTSTHPNLGISTLWKQYFHTRKTVVHTLGWVFERNFSMTFCVIPLGAARASSSCRFCPKSPPAVLHPSQQLLSRRTHPRSKNMVHSHGHKHIGVRDQVGFSHHSGWPLVAGYKSSRAHKPATSGQPEWWLNPT